MRDDAKTYRERAYHARMGAKEATESEHRAAFEKVAASYEAMALHAERRESGKSESAERSAE